VKTLATIELDDEIPERTRAILRGQSRIEVREGKKRPTLTVQGVRHPLDLLPGIAPAAYVTAPLLRQLTKPDHVAMVVAERLTASIRAVLEEAGCSYADGAGNLHLDVPGLLVHIETLRQTGSVIPAPRGLGAVAVRVVQTLLAEPERAWAVVDLVRASGASAGEAHKVLQRLETEGLVQTTGTGAARRRQIIQSADLLDWLTRVPAARKIHSRLNAYLYAPDPDGLVTRLSHHAVGSGITWALTGAAGARAMGFTAVTTLPVVMVRVPQKPGLVEAAQMLGAEPVDSGANLLLIADVGDVGTHGALRNGPAVVAPAVRIYLDMLGEPRGEDAAALFREAILGY
jgi:hypothetical protein